MKNDEYYEDSEKEQQTNFCFNPVTCFVWETWKWKAEKIVFKIINHLSKDDCINNM